MLILGIETSCDETAAAIVNFKNGRINVLSNIVSSQINLHQKYGGVVPEVAARAHIENIIPAIEAALEKAKVSIEQIDKIAFTENPGLIGSLLVGQNTANALSFALGKPLVKIDHTKAHIFANFIGKPTTQIKKLMPQLCLVVSGGHTSLILVKDLKTFKTLGQTRDDAAGEAFDKVAKLLGLSYPGGPAIEAIASIAAKGKALHFAKASRDKLNAKRKIKLPRPMINSGDFDFSFSGLKTAVLNLIMADLKFAKSKIGKMAIAKEFQNAVCDVLQTKTLKAAKLYKPKSIALAGGVSANKLLRKRFLSLKTELPKTRILIPDLQYTTDNAAMVAVAGALQNKL
jgi:N6-L-threonylcarbamoyladenine synthase